MIPANTNVSTRFRYICFHVLGTFLYGSYLVTIRRLLERPENNLINKSKKYSNLHSLFNSCFFKDVFKTINYK